MSYPSYNELSKKLKNLQEKFYKLQNFVKHREGCPGGGPCVCGLRELLFDDDPPKRNPLQDSEDAII